MNDELRRLWEVDYGTLHECYRNDPKFRELVETVRQYMEIAGVTSTDMIRAAVAAYMFEHPGILALVARESH